MLWRSRTWDSLPACLLTLPAIRQHSTCRHTPGPGVSMRCARNGTRSRRATAVEVRTVRAKSQPASWSVRVATTWLPCVFMLNTSGYCSPRSLRFPKRGVSALLLRMVTPPGPRAMR